MENFKKYDKIKVFGDEDNKDIFTDPEDEIVIEEKMDGGNLRFFITKNNQLIFGSRTQQLTSDEGEDTNIQKNFMRCVNFIRDKIKHFNDLEPFKNKIFFGENMVRHTISYDWDLIPPFLGFDIFDLKEGKYLDFKKMDNLYESLDLPTVPLIKICKVKDIKKVDDDIVPISEYNKLIKAEGVVFKNYKKQLMAKYVRQEFKEKNHEVFGGGKKYATEDEQYLTAVYCTNSRIDKHIFKLLDDGEKLSMELMHKLPHLVYTDIWEENWREINNMKNRTINFGKFKQQVSKRCLEVLKQSIINNSLK